MILLTDIKVCVCSLLSMGTYDCLCICYEQQKPRQFLFKYKLTRFLNMRILPYFNSAKYNPYFPANIKLCLVHLMVIDNPDKLQHDKKEHYYIIHEDGVQFTNSEIPNHTGHTNKMNFYIREMVERCEHLTPCFLLKNAEVH